MKTDGIGRLERDAGFQTDVGRPVTVREEAPAGRFEQPVDLDAGGGFVAGYTGSRDSEG